MIRIFIKKMSEAIKKEEKDVFLRRDRLVEMQKKVQKMWVDEKAAARDVSDNKNKCFVNAPYPYVNSRLHLGHGFTYIKADIYSRFKTLKGFNTLFPFAFHGTGMPIYAAAKKLDTELKTIGIEKLLKIVVDRQNKVPEVLASKFTQFEIMLMSGVKAEEIEPFVDPVYWLKYFPEYFRADLENIGVSADFSRSFITTDMNPYYDSFIRWQFEQLKKGSHIKFGLRPSIYSPKDKQMCADHDRSVGEEVGPQEYTLIKIILKSFNGQKLKELREKYPQATFVLPAATLRPETVYGQTNCFVLPTGEYGAFSMKNSEIWICSQRAADNAAFQNCTDEFGECVKVGDLLGTDLIGQAVQAPCSKYEEVFVWPMLTLKMDMGTGVVTSVPSDSPDDYAVMADLKRKKELREKFGLRDEQVLPFEPVEIIEIPGISRLSAVSVYERLKIGSMNDREKLAQAKDEVYEKGFYTGRMLAGEWAGRAVCEVKEEVRARLVAEGRAVKYWEPKGLCVSRTGGVCVVALLDQWYISYGEKADEEKLAAHVASPAFKAFNEEVRGLVLQGVQWLKDWGCSRFYGLGTRIPWDEQFLIESLSDSTIYMAYYAVSPFLQADVYGERPGTLGIRPGEMQPADWSFVFLGEPRSPDSRVPLEKLERMRAAFLYWYPTDVRFSAKDLAKNHMAMSLYNHEFIWGGRAREMLPRGYYLNGYVTVNGRKMSKQEGNFLTLHEAVEKYGADATRIMLANAGDTIDDANAVLGEADSAVLKIHALECWVREACRALPTLRGQSTPETEFFDRVFENELKALVQKAEEGYEAMCLREAVKALFYTLPAIKEDYRINCGPHGLCAPLVKAFVRSALIALFPLIPHFCEAMWLEAYLPALPAAEARAEPDRCRNALYPAAAPVDHAVLRQRDFVRKVSASLLSSLEKALAKKKAAPKAAFVVCSTEYKDWQLQAMELVARSPQGFKELIREKCGADRRLMAQMMEFANFTAKQPAAGSAEADGPALNDYQLLCEHRGLLGRDLKNCPLAILTAREAAAHANSQVAQAAQHCAPGSPLTVLEY